ncbi:MAG: 30S ribosomal protein S2 [Anaerolineae bacterium]
MASISMKALLEAGVHFGHRTRRWDPKMKQYIFTERNGIHIIDLQQTLKALSQAYDVVRDMTARGGQLLFIGTKRQAQESIRQEAERAGMPYVNQRWLGGTLTNFVTIRNRIQAMKRLEERQEIGAFSLMPKKEALALTRELERMHRRFSGLRNLERLPDIVFVVDVNREAIAVKEANRLGIPVIGMVDTNSDPDPIDYVIPSNDDAIRAIALISSIMADAAIEGRQALEAVSVPEAEPIEAEEAVVYGEEEEFIEPVFVPEFEIEEEAAEISLELAPEEDIVLTTDEGMGPESIERQPAPDYDETT